MKKKKVILTQKYQEEAIRQLKEAFDLVIQEDSGKNLIEILKENPDAEALISFLSDKIDKKIIEYGKNLKIIANYAVGYNNIDVEYAMQSGVLITNTPDILTTATADFTMALILAAARRVVEGDNLVRQGKFKGWGANLLLGKALDNCTLGIVGLGRIGTATAKRALGFGMKILYNDTSRNKKLETQYELEFKPLLDLIPQSDIISLHIPSSPQSHHLFDKKKLDMMKKDAIFINVSRGDLVDEAYLAEKLEKKELLAAGLDVYEFEPRVTEKLKTLPNLVLAPHLGSATYKARLGMAQMTIDNVRQVFAGKTPQNLIPEYRKQR